MVVNTALESGSCIIWISKNIQKYWMFEVLPEISWEPGKQTKHDNDNLQKGS